MACAAALYHQGESIRNIFDVVHGLTPALGRFAAGLFLLGAVSAGLSSLIPMAMILPLLLADYRRGKFQLSTVEFRGFAALACVIGLAGPMFGDQLLPIHRIASQIAQVFVLPLVVGSAFMLLNREELMGAHKAGFWLNAGLVAAFGFSLFLSWSGLTALGRRFA
jgi:Mn2+/Fe2+ NRAMP family transporter